MSYVFSFTFFSLPLIFTLHWWPLAFLILSPPLQNRSKSPFPLPNSPLLFLPVSSRFLPFPPTTQPGPRLMLKWFYNKDQFKFKRLKDGRCTCKNTGSSHLNAGFLVVVATLCRHTINDPINARGVYLILGVQAGTFNR